MEFSIEGAGEIVATDNGDPTDLESFSSTSKKAFNGMCLVIVKSIKGESGSIKLRIESEALRSTEVLLRSK